MAGCRGSPVSPSLSQLPMSETQSPTPISHLPSPPALPQDGLLRVASSSSTILSTLIQCSCYFLLLYSAPLALIPLQIFPSTAGRPWPSPSPCMVFPVPSTTPWALLRVAQRPRACSGSMPSAFPRSSRQGACQPPSRPHTPTMIHTSLRSAEVSHPAKPAALMLHKAYVCLTSTVDHSDFLS